MCSALAARRPVGVPGTRTRYHALTFAWLVGECCRRVQCASDTTGSCPIVVTRRYTVVDLCGNVSDTVRQVILVNDGTAPVVSSEPIDTLIGGCDAIVATSEARTVAELEAIGFTVEDACTPDAGLTVMVKADTTGSCPIVISPPVNIPRKPSQLMAFFMP